MLSMVVNSILLSSWGFEGFLGFGVWGVQVGLGGK